MMSYPADSPSQKPSHSQAPWTIELLKSRLSLHPEIKAWIINEEHIHRCERYFMLDQGIFVTDQDREIRSQHIQIKLFVDIAKPGRQGEISKRLFTALPLNAQLESSVEAAKKTDHQAWDLPAEFPKSIAAVKTTDPKMAEDLNGVMKELTDQILREVDKKRESQFNSAELFLSVHDNELHLSNGLVHRSSQSRIYAEAAYSYSRKTQDGRVESEEYLNASWAVSLGDLPLEKLFAETAERARASLGTKKPVTGRYPVIVDADVLATLFHNQLSQLSSANSYHGLPFIKPGDEWVKNARGDLLTITLDPSIDYGADTTALSETGILQAPFRLVDHNRVIATATDKRYADYLKTEVTSARGNVVVEPGTLSLPGLIAQAPVVIEILQFSGLFADPNSGTFSSEIRLARLHDNASGKTTYLKGGSLSGRFTENFQNARLSKERVKRAHFSANSPQGEGYFGPEYALLSDVSIVG